MIEDQSSRTAEYAAAFRALESVRRPAGIRLFSDPYAVAFLGDDIRRYVRLAAIPLLGGLVRAYVEWRSGGAMSSGIARTRLLDDWLLRAIEDGLPQVVLLGAGYDCRAGRLVQLSGCRVVEVDHPATQAAKRARLDAAPQLGTFDVTYVAADLMQRPLDAVWEEGKLEAGVPVFVLWEGVTHYLGAAAVDATLRALSRLSAPGSRLAFTYLHRGLLDGSVEFPRAKIPMRRVASSGEPWIFGIAPDELGGFLGERGFDLIEDLGANAYRTRYWGPAAGRLTGFGFYRAALARVQGPAGGAQCRPCDDPLPP